MEHKVYLMPTTNRPTYKNTDCALCSVSLTVSMKTLVGYVCPPCYQKHVIDTGTGSNNLLVVQKK
jgi:hypothetical protein